MKFLVTVGRQIEVERAPEYDKNRPAWREVASGRIFYFDGCALGTYVLEDGQSVRGGDAK